MIIGKNFSIIGTSLDRIIFDFYTGLPLMVTALL